MKRLTVVLLALTVLAMSIPAVAGEGHACDQPTQKCLDYLAAKAAKQGYEGLDGDYDPANAVWIVSAVHEDSPAVAAGFQVGDKIYSANDMKFSEMTEESWGAFEKTMTVGASVSYGVKRAGEKHTLTVKLVEMPEDEVAKMIGRHLVQHAQVASAGE